MRVARYSLPVRRAEPRILVELWRTKFWNAADAGLLLKLELAERTSLFVSSPNVTMPNLACSSTGPPVCGGDVGREPVRQSRCSDRNCSRPSDRRSGKGNAYEEETRAGFEFARHTSRVTSPRAALRASRNSRIGVPIMVHRNAVHLDHSVVQCRDADGECHTATCPERSRIREPPRVAPSSISKNETHREL